MNRYLHAHVKAMASTTTGEFAVVGLIVGAGRQWRVVPAGDRARALAYCGPIPVQAADEAMEQLRVDIAAGWVDEDYVASCAEWQSTVQVSAPMPLVAQDLDEALSVLLKVVPGSASPTHSSTEGVTPPNNEAHVDHIIRYREGGLGVPSNGQVLCRACNVHNKN